MIFFINGSFSEQNSGIEHAQLKRARLFHKHKEPFRLVYRDWNPSLHYYLNKNDVVNEDILNMFDFFQNTILIDNKVVNYKDIDLGYISDELSYQKELPDGSYAVRHNDQFIARINVFDYDDERVKSVEQFDGFGNLYKVDNYDYRGFNSLSQFYTPDNNIGTEVWYDFSGKPVIEAFNRYDGQKSLTQSAWRYTNEDGTLYTFSNIDELTLYFYNELNSLFYNDERLNIFVMDRNHLADWQLKHLDRSAYKVMHLHNSHAGDSQDPMNSVMNNFYEYGLYNIDEYDAIISATKKQTDDVKKRFNPKSKLFTIPVGIVPDEQFNIERVPIKDRIHGKVLVTARVAPEKRIHHIIEAIGIAKEKVPDISLDVYGYVDHSNNDKTLKQINSVIEKYNLQNSVTLNEYADNVGELQRGAEIYALASTMEGFNLSLMEATSNGMVGVTYDVNYGPTELIENNKNGYVVEYGNINLMAEKFVELFTNSSKLQKMSTKSYELSERYSETNIWEAWYKLLKSADKK